MPKNGYTLIELLVVLTIISILSIIAFVNFKTFSQDQILNKAASDIQSLLRLAQSNATSNIICGSSAGTSWAVTFRSDKTNLDLICGPTNSLQKTLTLEKTEVSLIQCSATSSTCPPTTSTFSPPLTVIFAPLYGHVAFSTTNIDGACVNSTSTLMVVLRNLNNNNYKCFTISKGGAIDIK